MRTEKKTRIQTCNMQKAKRMIRKILQVSPLSWFQGKRWIKSRPFHQPMHFNMTRRCFVNLICIYPEHLPNLDKRKETKHFLHQQKDIYINDQIAHISFSSCPFASPSHVYPLQFCTTEVIPITIQGPAIPNPTRWLPAWPP